MLDHMCDICQGNRVVNCENQKNETVRNGSFKRNKSGFVVILTGEKEDEREAATDLFSP